MPARRQVLELIGWQVRAASNDHLATYCYQLLGQAFPPKDYLEV